MQMKAREWTREKVLLLMCDSESSRLNFVTRIVNSSAFPDAMGCAH